MKKLFSVVAILAMVGTVLLAGCKKEEAPAVPDVPAVDTNAPAK
jgi:nitrous oxide reductase accessory protein NosL